MAVGIQVWSQTAANNATSDSNINFAEGQAPSSLNDSCRAVMASAAKWRDDNNGTLVTSGTSGAVTVVTNQVEAALTAGYTIAVQWAASVDTSATLAVDGLTAKPIQSVAGTNVVAGQLNAGGISKLTYSTTGTGQWIINSFPGTNIAPLLNTATNYLAANVTMNTTLFFDGPSAAQGSSGTWYASGTVTITDSGSNATFIAKLWDGTTTISAAQYTYSGVVHPFPITLSGYLASPAGNIRISVSDANAGGTILFNQTGTSKDSGISCIRIA